MASEDLKAERKPGLCLAGAGGLGFLHIGLFEALEELAIHPGIVAGTSSGAVMGALFAAGKTSGEIRAILRDFRWDRIVAPTIPRRGFLSTARMQAFYRKHLGSIDLSDLPIPLRVAAVDLRSGELTGFTAGPIEKCLAASCTMPGVFDPVTIDGRMYIDAGGIYNLPLELLSGEGLDCIIAGNTIGEYGLMAEPRTVQETYYQAYLIRSRRLTAWRTGPNGWDGRKGEKLVMVDYHSHGANPRGLKDCSAMIDETRELALEVLRKAFGNRGKA